MYPHYFSQNVGGVNQDLAYTLGRLSLIQHYASGTPLIDFTSSMWVGLFFAWKGTKVVQHSSNCCARNYIQLNYFEYNLSKGNDAQIDATGNTKEIPLQCIFEYKNGEDKNSIHDIMHCPSNIIFFADSIREYNYKGQLVNEANISNSRLKAQYGFFVIHTEETECLERKWFQLAKDVFPLRKILIHKSLLDNVEELLQEKFGPDMEKYLLPYFEDNVKQIIIDAQK